MIKIAILKRNENTPEENNLYFNAIKKFGGCPYFIDQGNLKQLEECDGIVITGGYSKSVLDDYLIDYALVNKLPLLGICQGMQSMAMYQSDAKLEAIDNHYKKEDYVHAVNLKKSIIQDIYNKNKIYVNSHHNETVKTSNLFNIVGISGDGLIEAVESTNHPFQIGVQWHPERMINYDDDSNKLFNYFLKICSEQKKII